jgi:hypothetical protein
MFPSFAGMVRPPGPERQQGAKIEDADLFMPGVLVRSTRTPGMRVVAPRLLALLRDG